MSIYSGNRNVSRLRNVNKVMSFPDGSVDGEMMMIDDIMMSIIIPHTDAPPFTFHANVVFGTA